MLQEPGWNNPRRARAVAASDQVVSLILEILERLDLREKTAVIVTGDHENVEVHTKVRPNVWLVKGGLRENGSKGRIGAPTSPSAAWFCEIQRSHRERP